MSSNFKIAYKDNLAISGSSSSVKHMPDLVSKNSVNRIACRKFVQPLKSLAFVQGSCQESVLNVGCIPSQNDCSTGKQPVLRVPSLFGTNQHAIRIPTAISAQHSTAETHATTICYRTCSGQISSAEQEAG